MTLITRSQFFDHVLTKMMLVRFEIQLFLMKVNDFTDQGKYKLQNYM